jgi:hypothetical protein
MEDEWQLVNADGGIDTPVVVAAAESPIPDGLYVMRDPEPEEVRKTERSVREYKPSHHKQLAPPHHLHKSHSTKWRQQPS